MVVEMEQGWDRVRGVLCRESTAFPSLTGTLVTAAGFPAIGFANPRRRYWPAAIYGRDDRAGRVWFVALICTPYSGVKMLPKSRSATNHDPHAVDETRVYRILRRM